MTEPQGLTHMANTASNLTLSSVLATLSTSIKPEHQVEDKWFNEGMRQAIQVIRVYQNVIQAEMRARVEGDTNE